MDARFQVSFTPLAGVLFAFPSRYWFTIGHHGVFSLGGWSPRIRTGFHVSRSTWDSCRFEAGFRLRGFHPLWPAFPGRSPNLSGTMTRSRDPRKQASGFGLGRVRSPLLAPSRLISVPAGTEMFHFPACGFARTIEFIRGYHPMKGDGLSHSEIDGSRDVDSSPSLIAVCRVLLRLVMPRHPSCARIRLAKVQETSPLVTLQFSFPDCANVKDRT